MVGPAFESTGPDFVRDPHGRFGRVSWTLPQLRMIPMPITNRGPTVESSTMIETLDSTAASPTMPAKISSRRPPRPPVLETKDTVSVVNGEDDLSFADFDHPASLSGFLEEPRKKITAVDVASVGNASDTLISGHGVSGRDLHETAKAAFNAGNYKQALPLFESILASQVRRFSALHPSVGAAMHNVGVRRTIFTNL